MGIGDAQCGSSFRCVRQAPCVAWRHVNRPVEKEVVMPRYVVERTFAEGLHIPVMGGGAELCRGVIERNTEEG